MTRSTLRRGGRGRRRDKDLKRLELVSGGRQRHPSAGAAGRAAEISIGRNRVPEGSAVRLPQFDHAVSPPDGRPLLCTRFRCGRDDKQGDRYARKDQRLHKSCKRFTPRPTRIEKKPIAIPPKAMRTDGFLSGDGKEQKECHHGCGKQRETDLIKRVDAGRRNVRSDRLIGEAGETPQKIFEIIIFKTNPGADKERIEILIEDLIVPPLQADKLEEVIGGRQLHMRASR